MRPKQPDHRVSPCHLPQLISSGPPGWTSQFPLPKVTLSLPVSTLAPSACLPPVLQLGFAVTAKGKARPSQWQNVQKALKVTWPYLLYYTIYCFAIIFVIIKVKLWNLSPWEVGGDNGGRGVDDGSCGAGGGNDHDAAAPADFWQFTHPGEDLVGEGR